LTISNETLNARRFASGSVSTHNPTINVKPSTAGHAGYGVRIGSDISLSEDATVNPISPFPQSISSDGN
jgi:hypothetical protein